VFTLTVTTEVRLVYLILTVLMSSYITCSISLFYKYKYILVVFTLTMTTEHLFVLQNVLHGPHQETRKNCVVSVEYLILCRLTLVMFVLVYLFCTQTGLVYYIFGCVSLSFLYNPLVPSLYSVIWILIHLIMHEVLYLSFPTVSFQCQ
jgi:hypothetical protein